MPRPLACQASTEDLLHALLEAISACSGSVGMQKPLVQVLSLNEIVHVSSVLKQ